MCLRPEILERGHLALANPAARTQHIPGQQQQPCDGGMQEYGQRLAAVLLPGVGKLERAHPSHFVVAGRGQVLM